jgi:hypothetical protein
VLQFERGSVLLGVVKLQVELRIGPLPQEGFLVVQAEAGQEEQLPDEEESVEDGMYVSFSVGQNECDWTGGLVAAGAQ